jgi:hypothetical protein
MSIFVKALFVLLINYVSFKSIIAYGGRKGHYSDQWLLRTGGGHRSALSLAENNGFEIIAEVLFSIIY